jgi:organic radical activating enzyme
MPSVAGNASEVFVSFQGEGLHVGRRQLFVRLGGCPLRCRYCDTPESLVPVPACRVAGPDGVRSLPNPIAAGDLERIVVELVRASPPLHAIAVTGGEPLMQSSFLGAWLGLQAHRLPVLLETAGIWPERLAAVLASVAIVSLDLKCPSNTGQRARWDEHEACLALAVAAEREVYVKMPVDDDTDAGEVEMGARLVARVAPRVPLFLTPLTEPNGTALAIGAAGLERFHAAAARHHGDVRVLPQLHKVLGIL